MAMFKKQQNSGLSIDPILSVQIFLGSLNENNVMSYLIYKAFSLKNKSSQSI